MGKISEEAKFYADHYLPDLPDAGMTHFLAPFRTIESEIKALADRIEVLEGCPSEGTLLEATIENLQNRIEALESKCGDIGWFMGQVKLNLRSIEALNERLKVPEDIHQGREILEEVHVSTDKDRPKFQYRSGETPQVGDTINYRSRALVKGGGIRIVLHTNPDNSQVLLLDVPSGKQNITHYTEYYDLVYRPGTPKPEPTVKEKIDTDKSSKPPGGLEPGDVMKYQLREGSSVAIFLFKEHNKSADMFTGYVLYCPLLEIGRLWSWQSRRCTFLFRPRFPDRKEKRNLKKEIEDLLWRQADVGVILKEAVPVLRDKISEILN